MKDNLAMMSEISALTHLKKKKYRPRTAQADPELMLLAIGQFLYVGGPVYLLTFIKRKHLSPVQTESI